MAEISFARLDELYATWEDMENALAAAQQAKVDAEAAQTGAEAAEQGAEDAQTAAETAQGFAEAAQQAAEAAQGLAESAQSGAEAAQQAAETAQGLAEDAQTAAEGARDDAVDARDDAYLWAQEDEDTPVDDGVHTGYSAYHWAEKAAASAGGTGVAYSVFGVEAGSTATRADITVGANEVLGRGSGNLDGIAVNANEVLGRAGSTLQSIKVTTDHVGTSDKTGADPNFVTGTAGTNGNLGQWNADGDMVDSSIAASGVYRSGGTDVAVADGGTGGSDASTARTNLVAATKSQSDFLSGIIKKGENADFRIIEYAPYAMTITKIYAKSSAGTITITPKINSTAITSGAINVTTSQGSSTPSAANVMAAGDALVFTLSSNSSAENISFMVQFTRTLA